MKKILLTSYLILNAFSLAQAASLTTTPVENPTAIARGWVKECEDRVTAAQGKPVDLMFIGDSLTQNFVEKPRAGWNLVGDTVWDQHYANRKALNFGVGGDGTQNILYRLDHMNVKSFTPKVIVLLCGVNNLGKGTTAEDIAAGVKAVLDQCQTMYPAAKIVLMPILPSKRDMVKTQAANAIIQTYADGKKVTLLDLTPFMPPVGDSYQGLGGDRLHLTPEGYEIWASQLDPILNKLMGQVLDGAGSSSARAVDNRP